MIGDRHERGGEHLEGIKTAVPAFHAACAARGEIRISALKIKMHAFAR
jgi:hypothetical protein